MTDLTEFDDKESPAVGSLNHSIVQTQIATLLAGDERFRVLVELSLDVSQLDMSPFGLKTKDEMIPDVCLYPNTVKFNPVGDILKMPTMPLLAIEVVSPRQGLDDIVNKFKVYFALGIKSCWLVTPTIQVVTVYSQLDNFKTFDTRHENEILDEVLDIRLPLPKIFF